MPSQHPLQIFTGSSHPELAVEIAQFLNIPLGQSTTTFLPDGELHVRIDEVVRGKDVFLLQTGSAPVNDHIIETLLYLDAFRRGSVNSVTLVMPYYPYARQERMSRGRESISARVMADLLESQRVSRVIYVDIHAPAIQGFFSVPVDPLSAIPILSAYFRSSEFSNGMIVSPDVGRAKVAGKYAELTGLPLAIIHKRRDSFTETRLTHLVGDVRGRQPIIIDDVMAGGSILDELDALYENGAEGRAYLAVTHPVLLPKALKKIEEDERIGKVVVTNTLPVPLEKRIDKIEVISIAPLLAGIIQDIHEERSISPKMVFC
ncbi:MAG: ribose-phosphate pyrophosphokinase [Anaerolineales bacterium]|nr:ribose-phosphate pyrophosphokinase [Anaerolineales bacterium]